MSEVLTHGMSELFTLCEPVTDGEDGEDGAKYNYSYPGMKVKGNRRASQSQP